MSDDMRVSIPCEQEDDPFVLLNDGEAFVIMTWDDEGDELEVARFDDLDLATHAIVLMNLSSGNWQRAIEIHRTTRGLSPECVAACIEAVKQLKLKTRQDHKRGCICLDCDDCDIAVKAAIALLPKEGT